MAIVGMNWENNFRVRMEQMRTAAGMTQTDLARILREQYGLPFHQATIQRIEAGGRPVRLNEAHLIAHAFQTDLDTMTAAYGTPAVVVSNLIGAAKAFMLRAESASRFLSERADEMQWHIGELRRAWEAYAKTQQQAGLEVDHDLAELVTTWEEAYRNALDAIGAVVKVGSADNLYRVGMASADAMERTVANAGGKFIVADRLAFIGGAEEMETGRPATADGVTVNDVKMAIDGALGLIVEQMMGQTAGNEGATADGINNQTA